MQPIMRRSRGLLVALLLVTALLPMGVSAGLAQAGPASVDPMVLQQTAGDQQATFWVLLRARADLRPAARTPGWAARGRAVIDRLQAVASASQRDIHQWLQSRNVAYRQFWIANAIQVTAGRATVEALAARPEVAKIVADRPLHIPEPRPGTPAGQAAGHEWNIDRIRAPEVWSTFDDRGEGIVVGSIDTGVQFDHPALVAQYRGYLGGGQFDHNYNWFDPMGDCGVPSAAPCDDVAHGTHTMGTILGDDGGQPANQIGVAPRARWITAKACNIIECPIAALLASGEWMLAPTDLHGQNPRPDLRPQVVNNSWGGPGGDEIYQAIVDSWVAAGIFPVFSAGNSGPFCGSAGSPGDYANTYAVGAFDDGNRIAVFSSRGPSRFGDPAEIKPNIAAPGVDVRSSVPGSGYGTFSGTSMAAPHIAGTVALLWSAAPALLGDISATRALLDQTAVDVADASCDAYPASAGDNLKNNVWGEGRIDAFAAVERAPRGPTGILSGTVTDTATGEPIVSATIHASGPIERTAVPDAAGAYKMRLPIGAYDLDVGAFGYAHQTLSVVVDADSTVVRSVALTALPTHAVSGRILDGGGRQIANARVTIAGTPIEPARSDTNGFYRFVSVPLGTYTMQAAGAGCYEPQTYELVVDGDVTHDFTLAQHSDSYGYTCQVEPSSYDDAGTVLALVGHGGVQAVSLPFQFTFYGQTYDTAYVGTDGSLNFLAPITAYPNSALPNSGLPNAAIYPFWDDLIVDGEASIRTDVMGAAPDRRFVIEWRNATLCCAAAERVSFEVALYENGQILTQYEEIGDSSRARGGSATIGIENETGTIALQYAHNAPLIAGGLAIRYGLPPNGFVQGVVTDANDGKPIAGATVRAMQNEVVVREAATDAQGFYRLQVLLGTYTVEAARARYSVESAPAALSQDGASLTRNFALRAGRLEADPSAFNLVLSAGQTRALPLAIRNSGTQDLHWQIKEAARVTSGTAPVRAITGIRRAPTWSRHDLPADLPRGAVSAASPEQLALVIDDPVGDARGSVDIATVRGGAPTGSAVSVALSFSAGTSMEQVGGYVFFDTDQDVATGFPPENFYGLPAQNIGVDYYAELFGIHNIDPMVAIMSGVTFEVVAVVPATIAGTTVAFDVPLDAVNDDGLMDCALVVGDFLQPTDWAPDVGHGTIEPFTDIPWLTQSATGGALAPGASQEVVITVDPGNLAPGIYAATIAIESDSPRQPVLRLPVRLVVSAYQQAVNVGGGAYVDRAGDRWAADRQYQAGGWGYIDRSKVVTTSKPIAGTSDPQLYQDARSGLLEYRFDALPPGVYAVELHFAELQGKHRGQRMFDIIVEGGLVVPAHDIAAEVGDLTADVHTFFVAVTDGQLSIRFVTRKGFSVPLVNAIRVTHRPDA